MGQGHITVDGKTEECFNVDRKNFPVKVASLKIRGPSGHHVEWL